MVDTHNYLTMETCATELGIAERTVRWLCEKFDWFGGKRGGDNAIPTEPWVITRDELERMKMTPRPSAGRPAVRKRRPIGESALV